MREIFKHFSRNLLFRTKTAALKPYIMPWRGGGDLHFQLQWIFAPVQPSCSANRGRCQRGDGRVSRVGSGGMVCEFIIARGGFEALFRSIMCLELQPGLIIFISNRRRSSYKFDENYMNVLRRSFYFFFIETFQLR